jgi:hypothetical protein
MKMKRGLVFLFIFLIVMFVSFSSALLVTPGKKEYNFVPNLEDKITYYVTSVKSQNQEYKIYTDENAYLSEYIEISKDKIIGSDKFEVYLKLPSEIEKPGEHRIPVIVEEKIDEETAETGIKTSITLKAIIEISVPYPGEYLEISLTSVDANIGEPVNFEIYMINKGKEPLNLIPYIEIYPRESNEKIKTLNFEDRFLKSQQDMRLKKVLNTEDFNAGKYRALAIVEYGKGKTAKSQSDFKLGELFINIVSYTRQIIIGGLRKFDIEIESGWNDRIDGAYAEVSILDKSNKNNLAFFKTSSTSLFPWENKTISGYFETDNFLEGFYDANITLIYYGGERGKSSSELVEVEFIKNFPKIILIISIILVCLILIISAVILIIKKNLISKFRRNIKNEKKNK